MNDEVYKPNKYKSYRALLENFKIYSEFHIRQ
jgi:hypothetical protein